jgi:hypothetical protein
MGADTAPAETTEGTQNESGLFDDYLQDIPEEVKPWGQQIAQKFSARVDEKLREAAEFRKSAEPILSVEGLKDLDPESLQSLVQLANMDEDSFKEWLGAAASEIGWQPELDEDSWASYGREQGWLDDDGDQGMDDDPMAEQLTALADQVKALQDEIQNGRKQQETTQAVQAAEQEMQAQLAEVQGQAGDAWNEDLKNEILTLAKVHIEEDNPIGAAWEHYAKLTGAAQGQLVDDKLANQHGASLENGNVDTSPPKLSWQNGASPKDAARARFQQG